MQDRFRVRGWSVFDSGYYDNIQNMYKNVGTTLSEGDIVNYELEVIGNIHETPELLEATND